MGILDDAIREHLELKRSHGAPEEELRRQEVEALGIAHDEAIREDEDVDAARAAEGEQDPALEDVPAPHDFDRDAVAAEEPVFEPEAEVEPLGTPIAEPARPARTFACGVEPEPVEDVEPAPRRHSDTPTQGFDALAEDDDDPFAEERRRPRRPRRPRPRPPIRTCWRTRRTFSRRPRSTPALVRAAASARLRLRLEAVRARPITARRANAVALPALLMCVFSAGKDCGGGRPPRRPPH